MWVIAKINNSNFVNFKEDIKKKISDENVQFYQPKFLISLFKKNKKYSKEVNLLNDYIFIFNEKFKSEAFLKYLKFTKGLKYFLLGHKENQNNIKKAIDNYKSFENPKGYLEDNFFFKLENKQLEFINGPFRNTVFEIIKKNKKRIDFYIGKIKAITKV